MSFYYILIYFLSLSLFFLFLKKTGKNVDYYYIYGLFRIGNKLSFLEKIANSKLVKVFEILSIPIGYILMFIAIFSIIYATAKLFPAIIPVIPGAEIYGFKFPIIEVFIAIFVSALIHEIAHALLIIRNNMKIKSYGIFFLGPFLGAFVEPSEDIFKLDKKKQIAIFHAGIFANILVAFVLFLIIFLLQFLLPSNVIILGKVPNITAIENVPIEKGEILLYINNFKINKIQDIPIILRKYSPGDIITLTTNKNNYTIVLSEYNGRPFIGLYFSEKRKFEFFQSILFWIFLINLGIGIGNSLPVFGLDGGFSLKILLDILIKDDRKTRKIFYIINIFVISMIILNLMLAFGK